MTSDLFRSKFGDERLFFRHETFGRDLQTMKVKYGNRSDEKKLWQNTALRRGADDIFGDAPVPDLPEDNDAAMEIIENGIREQGCPFAWLL